MGEFYDSSLNQWSNGLESILEIDAFGKTKIKDWNSFMTFV